MKIIGFTGTRKGMSLYQKSELKHLLEQLDWLQFHHGMCLGADEEASFIARNWRNLHTGEVIAHPCNLKAVQSTTAFYTTLLPVLPPLDRNDKIVEACDILIAAPLGEEI